MYQALYRKWRPKTFDDVIGQEHITETLKRQIAGGRLSHAYLFVGTRGTGKTTCAKILSRAINCQSPENGNPCNKCRSCVGIDNGSILDVLELDAASNNGVDNVRALREEAVFTPVDVKKRVYIIDEVHMLSTAAFNALLKILEEPPEHLIFILATTEIHKVPATILSRCQRFTFKRGLPPMIAGRLLNIAGLEGITLTTDAAALLARLSDGSFRDALSLLDQCASGDIVDYDRVISAIGLAGSDEIAGILTAVSEKDAAAALSLLDNLYSGGKVMASILEELTNLVRDVLIIMMMPKGGAGLLSGGFDEAVLRDYTKRFSSGQLLSMMEILGDAARDLSKSSGGRLAVELCLMRLCSRAPDCDMTSAPPPTLRPEAQSTGAGISAVPAQKAESRFVPSVPERQTADPREAAPFKADSSPEPRQEAPEETMPAAADDTEVRKPVQSSGDAWKDVLSIIQSKVDIQHYTFLSDPAQSSAILDSGTLTVKAKNTFVANMINVPAVTAALKDAAAAVTKKPVVVRITQEDDIFSGGSNKLDALSRFSGVVKFEE